MENPHNFTENEWFILCNRINAFGCGAPILRIMGKFKYCMWKAYHPEVPEPSWMKPVEQEQTISVNHS